MRGFLHTLLLPAVLAAGCGGSTATVTPTSPMTAEDEAAFENGIDYIETPAHLEGQWHRTWTEDIDRRIGRADGVAVVQIRTIRVDTDLDRRNTYRLHAVREREIRGSFPEETDLLVGEDGLGYPSVQGNDRRILDQRFVVFVKWETGEEGTPPRARWHLSPASEDVVRWVEGRVAELDGRGEPEPRVIIHEQ